MKCNYCQSTYEQSGCPICEAVSVHFLKSLLPANCLGVHLNESIVLNMHPDRAKIKSFIISCIGTAGKKKAMFFGTNHIGGIQNDR